MTRNETVQVGEILIHPDSIKVADLRRRHLDWEFLRPVLIPNPAEVIHLRRGHHVVAPKCEHIRWHHCAYYHIIRFSQRFVSVCSSWRNLLMLAMSRPAQREWVVHDLWFGKCSICHFTTILYLYSSGLACGEMNIINLLFEYTRLKTVNIN